MHVTKPPAPPRKLNPNISIELEAVVLKALAKASADRWQSMAELATALRNAVTIEGTRFTTGPPAGGRMSSTTLRSASGEVSGETPIEGTLGADTNAVAPNGWGRRVGVWVAGVLALAGVLAIVAFDGRRGSASAPHAVSERGLAAGELGPAARRGAGPDGSDCWPAARRRAAPAACRTTARRRGARHSLGLFRASREAPHPQTRGHARRHDGGAAGGRGARTLRGGAHTSTAASGEGQG